MEPSKCIKPAAQRQQITPKVFNFSHHTLQPPYWLSLLLVLTEANTLPTLVILNAVKDPCIGSPSPATILPLKASPHDKQFPHRHG